MLTSQPEPLSFAATLILRQDVLSEPKELYSMPLVASSSVSVTRSERIDKSMLGKSSSGGSHLVVFEGTKSFLYPLPSSGELIIGRSAEADLRLQDRAASRQHARLRFGPAEVVCEDLGSHNGTRVNGERLTGPRTLVSGDTIAICAVTLVFHSRKPVAHSREIITLAELRLRVEEEIERCKRYRHPANLVCLNLGTACDAAWSAKILARQLRVIDVAAWGNTPAQLWLLIPDLLADELVELINVLLEEFDGSLQNVQAGYAICPADACDADTLIAAARSAMIASSAGSVLAAAAVSPTRRVGPREVIVADAAMVRVYDLIEQIARTDLPVLIHGETGAGKELVALAVHENSPRKGQKFVAVNCAALQDTLLESELFGHERGAFTGAVATKQGLFELANGGTLFLDEVAEMSLSAQTKLLRAVEDKRIHRVGGVQERIVDLRIVAATHQDLEQAVLAGRFRKDLYYRLRHARVVLPPLRERPRELPLLARAFLLECCRRQAREPLLISDEVMTQLLGGSWPGNVRELRAAMEFAAATAEGPIVQMWHLPDWLTESRPSSAEAETPATRSAFRPIADELRELEQTRMRQALEVAKGVQLRAAELIRMPERTFYFKAKQYGLLKTENSPAGN